MRSRLFACAFVFAFVVGSCLVAQPNQVLFCRDSKLCMVDTLTSSMRCIFAGPGEIDSPASQPGGDLIATCLNSGHETDFDLALMTTSGATVRVLPNSRNYYRPTWSPDGRFVYSLNSSIGNTIARWSVSQGQRELVPVRGVPAGCEFLQMIAFSPSGKYASVLMDKFRQLLIAEVREDGFQVIAACPEGFSYVSQSVWLDDSSLLFVGEQNSERHELWKLFTRTGKTERVGVKGLWLRDSVTISPDGSEVVVCAMPDGKEDRESDWNLWRYRLADRTAQQLTTGSEDVCPDYWKSIIRGAHMAEQAVIIHFRYGNTDLNPLFAVEDKLIHAIDAARAGEFDGHDIAIDGSNGYFYMYSSDADRQFAVVRPVLESAACIHDAVATLRYGPPEANVMEKKVQIVR